MKRLGVCRVVCVVGMYGVVNAGGNVLAETPTVGELRAAPPRATAGKSYPNRYFTF